MPCMEVLGREEEEEARKDARFARTPTPALAIDGCIHAHRRNQSRNLKTALRFAIGLPTT